jgi:hypothetical protein
MKKILALAFAMVSAVGMFAAINSQLTIYLDNVDSDKEMEARIACGDTYSPFNAASCASYVGMYTNASNIGLYVQYNAANYSELYAPELVNVPLVVVTSREAASKQHYKFFAELGAAANNSQEVYVTDLRPDGGGEPVKFLLNNATEYAFDLSGEASFVAGENIVIADRFVINYVAPVVPDFEICFRDNKLQITANPYAENVVVKDANDSKVVNEAPVTPYQEIDLSALAAGRYTVELAGGVRKFIIVKQ